MHSKLHMLLEKLRIRLDGMRISKFRNIDGERTHETPVQAEKGPLI